MKNDKMRQVLPYAMLGAITLFCCWLFVGRYGIFGAKVDWFSQHSVFPEYFRQQFYQTGTFFPEFAANIGGGQNIYNFSYYGLYNPIILISYLLPFVKMSDYLMAAGVTGLVVSGWIFYFWLEKKGFGKHISFGVTLLFLLAGPMIFHAYRQIMFVNYMPFLCLAFAGMDRCLEKRRSGLLTVAVFLMILTSFYFSLGGMLALFLYGVSRCVELKKVPRFLWSMITAVLMSGVLLVPTAMVILQGRGGEGHVSVASLLIPDLSVLRFSYSSYGIGLTISVIAVLVVGLTYRKWQERLLTYGCLAVCLLPVFAWMLNGGLYVRDKVLIPFLPLLCYMTAVYLKKQKAGEISFAVNLTSWLITLGLLCYGRFGSGELAGGELRWRLILAEGLVLFSCFFVFWKKKRLVWLLLPQVLCLAMTDYVVHDAAGEAVARETYEQVTDSAIGAQISGILDADEGFWRVEQMGSADENSANLNRIWDMRQWISSIYSSTYHGDYQTFRQEVFEVEEPFRNDMMQPVSENPLFQKFMGVKYVRNSDGSLQIQEHAAPVAYATDRVISQKDYEALEFPYNQTALMCYGVVKRGEKMTDDQKEEIGETAHPVEIIWPDTYTDHLTLKEQTKVILRLQESAEKERILYIQFQVKNNRPNKDVTIWVNGIQNKLTSKSHFYYNDNTVFTFVTAQKPRDTEVELIFGKGDYEISNTVCYAGDMDILDDTEDLYQSAFQVDRELTKGNRISGQIDVEETGYFITSIPYDKYFEIRVDGSLTVGEKVNTAFFGFPIAEGTHRIDLVYHAPGMVLGKDLSILGILIFVAGLCRQQFLKKRN